MRPAGHFYFDETFATARDTVRRIPKLIFNGRRTLATLVTRPCAESGNAGVKKVSATTTPCVCCRRNVRDWRACVETYQAFCLTFRNSKRVRTVLAETEVARLAAD